MSACTPPLIWLLRDHADERELVINEGDDEVRAAYENEEKVYDQEADRLLDAAASALVGWLASPFKNPLHDREGKVVYLAHPPKEAQECTGFCIQENWAQLREREITEAAWGPCTRYLLNPEPMQKAGVRAATANGAKTEAKSLAVAALNGPAAESARPRAKRAHGKIKTSGKKPANNSATAP